MRFNSWPLVLATCAFAVTCTGAPSSATYVRTTLKVIKRVIPDNDPGKFNLHIDGNVRASNVGHNGTTGPVLVQAGSHTVAETAGTATNLGNYIRTFSGDCNSAGVVVIPSGGYKTCIVTNKLRRWVTKAAMPTAREYFGVGV